MFMFLALCGALMLYPIAHCRASCGAGRESCQSKYIFFFLTKKTI